ncbi:LysR family transcriptional regulator [Roseomonas sp. 18066]|uniref:LysR family transcriptional regulator n=1 Tax=Roseomonas sp. 18066 TaxID=2681412 RepID=UPI001F4205B3|nr:LysR family transcriptional regulator [Roseomonas sp. 18066]
MKPRLADLTAFAMVAEQRSFRRAADALGLAPSSLSHAIAGLERQLGLRLFHRTTRSVGLTEAGERLLARLGPLLQGLDAAVEEVTGLDGAPQGVLRLNAPEAGARLLLRRVVPRFRAEFPGVVLDLVVEGRLVDIVAEGFDAGIRLGESLPQDMIAIRLGPEERFLTMASPAYLAARGRPETPDALAGHDCIGHRMPSGKLYRWEFERHAQERIVTIDSGLILNHPGLMLEAALAGLGIAYLPESLARPHLDSGALQAVLAAWCPVIPGLFLYYPGHRHVPAPLRAFIDTLRRGDG